MNMNNKKQPKQNCYVVLSECICKKEKCSKSEGERIAFEQYKKLLKTN